jgi:hypothetical protein
MPMTTVIRRLWRTFVSELGAEAYSVMLALIVIVGLTAITATGP